MDNKEHHQTRFSVIIPAYNRGEMIKETIDSVLSQDFRDFELIVVDDGSTDQTPRILAEYGEVIRAIAQKNSGAETARNRGSEAAKGEYLAFLDSDDLFMPWTLKVYDTVISATAHPALIMGRMINFGQDRPALPADPGADVEVGVYRDYLSKDRQAPRTNSTIVVRKDIFQRAGGYRCKPVRTFPHDDTDFLLRAGVYGPTVVVLRPTTVAYRRHEGRTSVNTKYVAHGVLTLIRSEKEGIYPGGRSRVVDRYASIGGSVLEWSERAWSGGCASLGLRLFATGFPMIAAGAFRKLLIRLRGRIPTVRVKL